MVIEQVEGDRKASVGQNLAFVIVMDDIIDIVTRLRAFMENEAKSCSMDFGCISPEYVHRMWGGTVKLEEIEKAMAAL
jgi:hypothetical protein